MTKEQAIACAKALQAEYFPAAVYTPTRCLSGNSLFHLGWMVREMETSATMGEVKIMRWLGYIQGALVMCGVARLDDMKEASRFAVHGPVAP